VLVKGNQRLRADTVMIEELRGDARILGRDHVDASQHFERAQRDVLQVTDRRGDYI
jgi:hypothetical protein